MIIAVPLENGKLCPHFGHCASFGLFHVDPAQKKIAQKSEIAAPPHEPGLLPNWLAERGVTLVICGGMGPRALDLLAGKKIKVVTGAPADAPEALVARYLANDLETAANICHHE